MTLHIPNPGSAAAVELGCLCSPVMNEYGMGTLLKVGGIPSFHVEIGCPIHWENVQVPERPNRCAACNLPIGAIEIAYRGQSWCSRDCIPAAWRDEDDASLGDTEAGE